MAITKKSIVDSVLILATRFARTDDNRLDEDYLGALVEQVRASEILKEYNVTGMIDQNWLLDFGFYDMTKVNFADDPNVDFCACDISKAILPKTISLTALKEGNLDLSLKVLSACGKTNYTFYPIENWRLIPKEHIRNKFPYYQRFGTTIYVNRLVDKLRFFGIPETTDGLILKRTLPVSAIKLGVTYMVKGTSGMVTYNGVNYLPNDTFVGVIGVTTFTATDSAKVYFNNYETSMSDTDPYPVSPHLARQIVISILTTEFQIEKQQATDIVNDSADDVLKAQ